MNSEEKNIQKMQVCENGLNGRWGLSLTRTATRFKEVPQLSHHFAERRNLVLPPLCR